MWLYPTVYTCSGYDCGHANYIPLCICCIDILQEYIRWVIKPANKEELIQGIRQFWDTVDVQKCRRYIGHLKRVLPRIVELDGDATGF